MVAVVLPSKFQVKRSVVLPEKKLRVTISKNQFLVTVGKQGPPGGTNVLTIGSVSTGAPGSNAAANITGISPSQVLNLTIPRGDPGVSPTLTGDVTGSGVGTVSTTIANNAVTFAKMAQVQTGVLLGRNTPGIGNVEALTTLPASVMPAFFGDVVSNSGSLTLAVQLVDGGNF